MGGSTHTQNFSIVILDYDVSEGAGLENGSCLQNDVSNGKVARTSIPVSAESRKM